MKITVEIQGKRYAAKPPHDQALYVVVSGVDPCPGCKKEGPLEVQGAGKHIESRDTYAAVAVTRCCSRQIGTIRVMVNTIFGIEEDEAVQCGRWRVY